MMKGPPKRTILSSTKIRNPFLSKLLGQKSPEIRNKAPIKYP